MKDPTIYHVRALERAIQILSCFDDDHPERGVSEIAEAVGLHKATVHRIMLTLVNGGFLERAPHGERYRLGLRLAEMGLAVVRRLDFRREAMPYMQALHERFGETCDLSIFARGEVLYLEVVQSRHGLQIAARPGQRLPAHCTASGKVFLAFLPADELTQVLSGPLRRYTENTITSPARILRQLEEIRTSGYACDDGEYEAGVRAVAAPIRNDTGEVVAAISMAGPTARMDGGLVAEMAAALVAAADGVSAHMGWQRNR